MHSSISFDPAKSQKNEAERDLPFWLVASLAWDSALIERDTRKDYGEHRYRVLGLIDGRFALMSKRKIQPDMPDTDNPEWTDADFARARPAQEVLPGLFSQARSEALLTPRGRPKAEVTKVRVGIRLSAEVIEHFKASGNGWQTRIDAALRQFIAEHPGAH